MKSRFSRFVRPTGYRTLADAGPSIRSATLTALLLPILVTFATPALALHAKDHVEGAAAQESASPGFNPLDALKQIGLGLTGGGNGNEFLHPEAAFVLSTDVIAGQAAVVRWEIAAGYYLYRERFKFEAKEPTGVTLGTAELPRGKVKEDSYFGRQEVYYQEVEARIPMTFSGNGSRDLQIEITYQGCADAGLCYPPITKTVALTVPPASGADTSGLREIPQSAQGLAATDLAGDLPEQDRLARALATGSTGLVLLAFFGLGLLLTFTPCVLPMIPILSSIIVGQGAPADHAPRLRALADLRARDVRDVHGGRRGCGPQRRESSGRLSEPLGSRHVQRRVRVPGAVDVRTLRPADPRSPAAAAGGA